MRHIGNLESEQRARAFGDFLFAHGIRNEVEADGHNSWSLWVVEEDRVEAARGWLDKFRLEPGAPEFRDAAAKAEKARSSEAADLANYRRRIRTRRSVFPKFGGYGFGVLTYGLVIACLVVAYYSHLGKDPEYLRRLFISERFHGEGGFLPEVCAGEVWRLITPIFIHFTLAHIVFNLIWLYQLGCMIEARNGSFSLAALVLVIGVGSNLAQYVFGESPAFGGMSGVVYGLAGYAWMRGKYDRTSGLYLDPQSVTLMLVWLVVCFTGWLGPIANWAHLAGLALGVGWGRAAAFLASRTPE